MEENKDFEFEERSDREYSSASETPNETPVVEPMSVLSSEEEEPLKTQESTDTPFERNEPTVEQAVQTCAEETQHTPWDFGGVQPREHSKEKKAFFGVFGAVLAVCLALLIGLSILGQNGIQIVKTVEILRTVYTKADDGSGDLLTPQEAADVVARSTVTVMVTTATGTANGSGFVYDDQGHICTNHHVIQDAKRVQIMLADGTALDAEVLGYEASSDLAVLKADPAKLTPATMGVSAELLVGDDVVVVGTPLGIELWGTTTFGKISFVDRWLPIDDNGDGVYEKKIRVIQTDTPVNPGNSGGPIADMYGRVVGIMVRKMTGKESIGFAIPIDGAKTVLDAIIANGSFTGENPLTEGRSLVGITGHAGQKDMWYMLDEESNLVKSSSVEREGYHRASADGVYVMSVDGANAKGVLQVGDVICSVNGLFVQSTTDLVNAVNLYRVGQTILLGIVRNETAMTVQIMLAEG